MIVAYHLRNCPTRVTLQEFNLPLSVTLLPKMLTKVTMNKWTSNSTKN